jgi:serine protease Do
MQQIIDNTIQLFMAFRKFSRCRCSLLLLLTFASQVTAETEQTYEIISPSVLQVLIMDVASGTKSSFGSGFYVGDQGYVVTNFHVISDLVFHPQRHRAEYRNVNNQRGSLTLVHFDVVNDLAVLRSEDYIGPGIDISGQVPANGARLYAMGHPHDLGLSVVEGTYNGLLEDHMIPRIHYTGSLNPGMSGGPALDSENRLVGVNVAGMGNAVSFLVPARYVAMLMSDVSADHFSNDFKTRVAAQLAEHQHAYLEPILSKPFQRISLGQYRVPGELSATFECWGSTNETDERLYSSTSHRCETSDYIYLSSDDHTGMIEYRHEYFETDQLSTQRFYAFLETHLQSIHAATSASEDHVTRFSCQENLVVNNDLDMKLVSCLRAHKIVDDIYDFFMILTTIEDNDSALYSVLMASGVSFKNGIRLQRKFLDAISKAEDDATDD